LIVAPAIGQLTAQYPQIKPHLIGDDRRLDLLEQGIDLAVRVGQLPSSNYRQRRIGSFVDVLCASPAFIRAHQSQIEGLIDSPDGLSGCDYIANSWQGSKVSHGLTQQKTKVQIELNFVANRFANSLQAVLAMAKAGGGIALIPDFIFKGCQQKGELAAILPDFAGPQVPVYTLHAFDNQPPLLIQLCAQQIKQGFETVQRAELLINF
jgi:DNA-binding transcriptional LysR family regulator